MTEDKLCFVAVEFVDDDNVRGYTYWYLCKFSEVKVGDKVIAPLGRHNGLQEGIVRKVVFAFEENSPYPMYGIKSIRKLVGKRNNILYMPVETPMNNPIIKRDNSNMCISAELVEAFDCAEKINVYNEGKMSVYGTDNTSFNEIIIGWKSMLDGAYTMPAFGVSLDAETREALNEGLWVEFEFNRVMEYSQMTFKKLLVRVERSFSGFNLIRYTEDRGYYGRCFYYNLGNKNMSDFYDILLNL